MLEKKLDTLYQERFSEKDTAKRNGIWKVLCKHFFHQWIRSEDTVVDLGAGDCLFINNVVSKNGDIPRQRIAIDINPDVAKHAESGVECRVAREGGVFTSLQDASVDIVFMSNILEHVDKETIALFLQESFRVLKNGGMVMIMGPNIRFCSKNYWDFFDHITPLSDRSLKEAITLASKEFHVVYSRPKFMPYTTKSLLPENAFLVRLYLLFPLAWRILGKQFYFVVQKQ